MNDPILKTHWERFKAHIDLDVTTATKLLSPEDRIIVESLGTSLIANMAADWKDF